MYGLYLALAKFGWGQSPFFASSNNHFGYKYSFFIKKTIIIKHSYINAPLGP